MATATKSVPQEFTEAAEQVTLLNNRVLQAGKELGNVYLGSYEDAISGLIATERDLAKRSPVELVSTILNAHADLTDELATAYTKTARETLS